MERERSAAEEGVVARCNGVADVVAAVRRATQSALPIVVREGGQCPADPGYRGLVIDCSPMRGVLVDPAQCRVRVQAGASWGELDRETQVFGLASTGALVSTSGVAESTLNGTFGWLMRKHGLAADNLIALEVVTADGHVVRADCDEHGELFWALRSGAGILGVITCLEFRLHPVGTVLGGTMLYPGESAAEVYAAYAELAPDEPDEMCTLVTQCLAPHVPGVPEAHRDRPVVAVTMCYAGPLGNGEAAIRPWRTDLPLLADGVKPMSYTAMQSVLDGPGRPPRLSPLDCHLVDDLGTALADPGRSIAVCHLEGVLTRRPSVSTALAPAARYAVTFDGSATPGAVECDALSGRVRDVGTAERLAAVGRRYDPTNRFGN